MMLVSQVSWFEGLTRWISNPTEDYLPQWHLGSISFAYATWVGFAEGVSWQLQGLRTLGELHR